MIKSKPAALPLYYVSTHSLMAVVVLTVEVTLPATPPAVSSGKSATLRLPLSIINGGVLQTHAAELPRGRACPVCSQLNRAGQRGGSGSSVPRPAVCVRASSHTSSNNGKKEVSTTTTQKAMRGPWTSFLTSSHLARSAWIQSNSPYPGSVCIVALYCFLCRRGGNLLPIIA